MTVLIITLFLFGLGFLEQKRHLQRVNQIPIRIHVNGTRGKSSTTRLIAAGLKAGGFRVMAKTTGTAPRVIFPDGREESINRRGKVNIIEQIKVVSWAYKENVDVLVVECMAVNPENQWISEHKVVKSSIGVLTNIALDHMEEFGDELDGVAQALLNTVPQNGIYVTTETRYSKLIQERATQLSTKVRYAQIKDRTLDKAFAHKQNLACALEVCELMGVNEERALQGMEKAGLDPGNLFVKKVRKNEQDIWFVNAFAANNADATVGAWEWAKKDITAEDPMVIGILNCREDRILRTLHLLDITDKIDFDIIIMVGEYNYFVIRDLRVKGISVINLTKTTKVEQLMNHIYSYSHSSMILFGFGNTKGIGELLIQYMKDDSRD